MQFNVGDTVVWLRDIRYRRWVTERVPGCKIVEMRKDGYLAIDAPCADGKVERHYVRERQLLPGWM